MTEAELIKKIQELKQIQPRKDWVLFTKSQIFSEEPKESFASVLTSLLPMVGKIFPMAQIFSPFRFLNFKNLKPVLVTLASLFILISGAFIFAQNSLPGDLLFSAKKITERSQSVFVSDDNIIKFELNIAEKRLDDLAKVTEKNSVKNLAPAINEYKESVSDVAKSLAVENNKEVVKEIVSGVKKLEEKEQQVRTLGAVIGENEELGKAVAQKMVETLETLIKDLEGRTLTEDQQEDFAKAKEYFEAGDYNQALIELLNFGQERED